MSFIRQIIERKISGLTHAWVTFGDFKFSPISGKIEVAAIKIAPERFVPPVLSIDRLEAFVSVKRALKGEIAIKSLLIEKPNLILSMHADGSMNFVKKSHAPATAPTTQESDSGASAWDFNAEKITITHGRAEFRDATRNNFVMSIEGVNATLAPEGSDIAMALSADSIGRRDHTVDLGALHCIGKLTGAGFSNLGGAALSSRASIADAVVLNIASSYLANRSFDIDLAGTLKLITLLALIPLSPAQRWNFAGDGKVELTGKFKLDVLKSVHVTHLDLKIGAFEMNRTFGSHGAGSHGAGSHGA